MKSNFNQYFNILFSCKHRFKLWKLSPATGVIYAMAVWPSVLPALHKHCWVAEALQRAVSAPLAVLNPGRNFQVVSGVLFHLQLIFNAISLADSRAVDSPIPCFCPMKAAPVGAHLPWWPRAAPHWCQWELPGIATEE